MKTTNKFFRAFGVVYWAICDLVLMAILLPFVSIMLYACKVNSSVYDAWLSYGIYAYIGIAFLLVVRNTFHRIKWYVRAHPINIQCNKCHTQVPLTRYREEDYLKSPISFCIPKANQLFRFVGYRVLYYKIAYRPYLEVDCPDCGEKHVICPYCHDSIASESIECKYDKPSVCPHCGKKIYTPIPIQEWEDAICVGTILD